MPAGSTYIQNINVTIRSDNLDLLDNIRANSQDIKIMIRSGVFNFRGGKAVIHRDHDGRLRRIDIEDNKYRV